MTGLLRAAEFAGSVYGFNMFFVGFGRRVIFDERSSRRKEVLDDSLVSLKRVFLLHCPVDLEAKP